MTSNNNNDCSAGKFKRLNYYHGMLLTEQDFQAEQNYFREKMKLHNRLHGYGVVWGLELKSRCTKLGGQSVNKIFIEPGFALDCEGNEIIVCHPYKVPIDEKIDQLADSCQPIDPCTKLVVAISYCECKSEPQPQYAGECGDDDPQPQFSRIREGFSVQVLLESEVPECCKKKKQEECCSHYKQDCPGLSVCCETEHLIILGCVVLDPNCICSGEENVEKLKQQELTEADKKIYFRSLQQASSVDREFTDKNIDPCCQPPRICKPCPTPQEKWERQKQKLLHEGRKMSGVVEFCCLIGKSICDAKSYLENSGITGEIKIREISNIYNTGDLYKIEGAECYASTEDNLVLVIDEHKQCVVFAYVDRGEY